MMTGVRSKERMMAKVQWGDAREQQAVADAIRVKRVKRVQKRNKTKRKIITKTAM